MQLPNQLPWQWQQLQCPYYTSALAEVSVLLISGSIGSIGNLRVAEICH
jgi:hypothetical protein